MAEHKHTAELTWLVKRLYILMNLRIDETLKTHDMARSQFQVLYHVNRNGQLTQKELQDILRVEPATLSGLIDVLERKGWLERTAHPTDKRAKLLKLTAGGKHALAGIPHPGLAVEKQMLKSLKKDNKSILKSSLKQIIENLEAGK